MDWQVLLSIRSNNRSGEQAEKRAVRSTKLEATAGDGGNRPSLATVSGDADVAVLPSAVLV